MNPPRPTPRPRYTLGQYETLLRMRREGHRDADIAHVIGRSEASVRAQVSRLFRAGYDVDGKRRARTGVAT